MLLPKNEPEVQLYRTFIGQYTTQEYVIAEKYILGVVQNQTVSQVAFFVYVDGVE